MKNNQKLLLSAKNLAIGYITKHHKTVIASSLNIESFQGSFICLLGENGIGKSTLLRTISQVQPKLSGSIFLKNKPIENYSNLAFSKEISLVLTERIPESNITVFELVALGRQPYTNWIGKLNDKDLEIINLALTQTNTLNIKNKKYYELSDGQLQKVLIARALAQNTDIIILDEPTAHLDLHHTFETFLLLKKLTTHFHKTVIISTHEINLALQLASEIWLMSSKKFVTGKTNQLIETNQLKDLFDSDLLKFDKRKKQFIFQSKQ